MPRPGRFNPGIKRCPFWVCPRAGLDKCEKFLGLTGIRSTYRQASGKSLYRLQYPGQPPPPSKEQIRIPLKLTFVNGINQTQAFVLFIVMRYIEQTSLIHVSRMIRIDVCHISTESQACLSVRSARNTFP
jgi:hypothetical protein